MKPSPRTITFTLGLLTVWILAGCGGQTTGATGEMSIQPAPASREAYWGIDGTNLQLVNNSGWDITVVEYESSTNSGHKVIKDGETASAEGTAFTGYDVSVTVRFKGGVESKIQAGNPIDGEPYVKNGVKCLEIPLLVGEEHDYVIKDGLMNLQGITVKRLPDDNWKQLEVTFTATKSPDSTDFCPPGGRLAE